MSPISFSHSPSLIVQGGELESTFSPDLKGLIAWLETQEPGGDYCVSNAGVCLFGRFHQALGIKPVVLFDKMPGHPYYGVGLNDLYPSASVIASNHPRTFGAALTRARRALSEAR